MDTTSDRVKSGDRFAHNVDAIHCALKRTVDVLPKTLTPIIYNKNSALWFLPPANEVCEGYVFTPVCQTFCSQGGAWSRRGGWSGEGCLAPGGCLLRGGLLLGGGACDWSRGGCLVEMPPGRLLLQMVRIPLECILVLGNICTVFCFEGSWIFLIVFTYCMTNMSRFKCPGNWFTRTISIYLLKYEVCIEVKFLTWDESNKNDLLGSGNLFKFGMISDLNLNASALYGLNILL